MGNDIVVSRWMSDVSPHNGVVYRWLERLYNLPEVYFSIKLSHRVFSKINSYMNASGLQNENAEKMTFI